MYPWVPHSQAALSIICPLFSPNTPLAPLWVTQLFVLSQLMFLLLFSFQDACVHPVQHLG